jgi:hypothetical protein
MVDKNLTVTVMLDCCFSSSVLRNDSSVRYLDYSSQIDVAHPPKPGEIISSESPLKHSTYRDVSLRPNWLVNPDGYTIITACGPTESSGERRVGEQVHGLLSYF